MKKFFSCLALLSLVFLTACEKENPTPAQDPTQLAKPTLTVENVTEDGFTVVWSAVENAAAYTVLLGDNSTTQTETSKVFADLEPGTYTVKVKANAAQGSKDYLDSDYAEATATIEAAAPAELTFEFEVSEITTSTALLTVYPSDENAAYYFDNMSKAEFEAYDDPNEIREMIVEVYAEMGAEEGLTLEETLELMSSIGEDSWMPSGMEANTEYVVFAFGWNFDGTFTTDIQYETYRTLSNTGSDGEFLASMVVGDYYGNMYTPDWGNYWIFLTDGGFDEFGVPAPNSTYYRLDLYAELATDLENIKVPVGTYELDPTNSYAMGTMSAEYSAYWQTDGYGDAIDDGYRFDSATLVVTEEGMTLTAVIDGKEHVAVFEGDYALNDKAPKGSYSTLTENLALNLEGSTVVYGNWGDYWGAGGQNFFIEFYPENYTGDYVCLDIITTSADAATGFLGSYIGSFNFIQGSFVSGFDDSGYPMGSWYLGMEEGDVYAMAPFKTGDVIIGMDDSGNYTVMIDVIDDAGYEITGEWSGEMTVPEQAPRRDAMVSDRTKSFKRSYFAVKK